MTTTQPTALSAAERQELNRLREQERIAEINDSARVVEGKSAHHPRTLQLLDEAKVSGRRLDEVWAEVCNTMKAESAEWHRILDAASNAGKSTRPGR